MSPILLTILVGSFGAAAMELLKLREMYGRLAPEHFARVWKCPLFWTLSVGFVAAAGFFTFVVHGVSGQENLLAAMITGAGFRSFGREGLGALVQNQRLVQGDTGTERVTLREILG